jgi:hypothetical protein
MVQSLFYSVLSMERLMVASQAQTAQPGKDLITSGTQPSNAPTSPSPLPSDAAPEEIPYLPDLTIEELDSITLPPHVTRLPQVNAATGEQRRVFLIGTAHISFKVHSCKLEYCNIVKEHVLI